MKLILLILICLFFAVSIIAALVLFLWVQDLLENPEIKARRECQLKNSKANILHPARWGEKTKNP